MKKNRYKYPKELVKGKIQLGKLSLPLRRLLGYNQYEKFRLGFGLETSPQISRRIILGGYFAYGTNDKEWKYGLYSNVTISQKRNTQFGLNFQQDLIERGGQVFTSSIFELYDTERLRELYVQQKDRQRLAEISFSSDIKANMNVRLFTNYQRIGFTNGYEFSPSDTALMSSAIETEVAVLGVELKWNIGERYMLLGESKVSQGLKYPSIKFKAIKGFKGVWESDFDYWRFNLLISQKIKVRDYFSINLCLTAMKTIGDVPISLMHNGRGTRINWNINRSANSFVWPSTEVEGALAMYNRMRYAMANFRNNDASAISDSLVELDPNLAVAHIGKLHYFFINGERDNLVSLMKKVKSNLEGASLAEKYYLETFTPSSSRAEILEKYEKALLYAANDPLLRAFYSYYLEDLDARIENTKIGLKRFPENSCLNNMMAYIMIDKGDLEAAMNHLKVYITVHPDEPNAYDSMGDLLLKMGKEAEAKEMFLKAYDMSRELTTGVENFFDTSKEKADKLN